MQPKAGLRRWMELSLTDHASSSELKISGRLEMAHRMSIFCIIRL